MSPQLFPRNGQVSAIETLGNTWTDTGKRGPEPGKLCSSTVPIALEIVWKLLSIPHRSLSLATVPAWGILLPISAPPSLGMGSFHELSCN